MLAVAPEPRGVSLQSMYNPIRAAPVPSKAVLALSAPRFTLGDYIINQGCLQHEHGGAVTSAGRDAQEKTRPYRPEHNSAGSASVSTRGTPARTQIAPFRVPRPGWSACDAICRQQVGKDSLCPSEITHEDDDVIQHKVHSLVGRDATFLRGADRCVSAVPVISLDLATGKTQNFPGKHR